MTLRRRDLAIYLLMGACLVVITFGLRASANVLNPVLMATFLALLLQPLAEWLNERARLPAGLALTLVVLAVVVSGLAVVGFMAASVQEVVAEFPTYRDRLAEQLTAISGTVARLGERFGFAPGEVDLYALPGEVLRSPEFGRWLLGLSQGAAGALGNTVLTMFIFAFALGGVMRLDTRLEEGAEPASSLAVRFMAFSVTIRRYMWIRAVLGLLASALNYVLLLALGVDFALLWAVLSFVLSFVPNIGYTLSVIPPVLMALVEGGWKGALAVFIGYTIINNGVDNVIAPRYVGQQMQISALLSFLSVIFWAWVLGPTGAILAVPMTVFLRDLVAPRPAALAPNAPGIPIVDSGTTAPPPVDAPPVAGSSSAVDTAPPSADATQIIAPAPASIEPLPPTVDAPRATDTSPVEAVRAAAEATPAPDLRKPPVEPPVVDAQRTSDSREGEGMHGAESVDPGATK